MSIQNIFQSFKDFCGFLFTDTDVCGALEIIELEKKSPVYSPSSDDSACKCYQFQNI